MALYYILCPFILSIHSFQKWRRSCAQASRGVRARDTEASRAPSGGINSQSNSGLEVTVTPTSKKLQVAKDILLAGSDVQSITGIALLISGLIQIEALPFYHGHILYDTISLVAMSNCAAMACSYSDKSASTNVRYFIICVWSVLYIAFVISFRIQLQSWNDEAPGKCYVADSIAMKGSDHPEMDKMYVAITCSYVFFSLLGAVLFRFIPYPNTQILVFRQFCVIIVAMLQV